MSLMSLHFVMDRRNHKRASMRRHNVPLCVKAVIMVFLKLSGSYLTQCSRTSDSVDPEV